MNSVALVRLRSAVNERSSVLQKLPPSELLNRGTPNYDAFVLKIFREDIVKITALRIENFKALKRLEIATKSGLIILAGPNGCGKTCVLDAIRLLKSAYGGYVPNETQSWMNEFNIQIKATEIDSQPLLHDKTKKLMIRAEIILDASEIAYLHGDLESLVRDMAINESPQSPFGRFRNYQTLAQQVRENEPAIREAAQRIRGDIASELAMPSVIGELSIHPDGKYELKPSRLLELLFSTFKPTQIGVLDFQTSNRNYRREPSGSIHISIDQAADQTEARARSHSLYNHEQRYADLKQQLASAYVKELIAKAAGITDSRSAQDLNNTLSELFIKFIPGKSFAGAQANPNGSLTFNVTSIAGATHDINDLSSGEKEILYGYLVLHNRTPRNSILMIDEPELHLNPRLVEDLPSFYGKHLGSALGNQLWLVTHSDAIVRGAIASQGSSVFHLQPAEKDGYSNQATEVRGDDDMRSLVLSLVGDLAAYRPSAPIVIFEGGADVEDASTFDTHVVSKLFPDFSKRVNCVSGYDKKNVIHLQKALSQAKRENLITQDVFSIVDSDDTENPSTPMPGQYQWDRYHIENFLLEPEFILEALDGIFAEQSPFSNVTDIENALKSCAEGAITEILNHRIINWIRNSIQDKVNIGCNPNSENLQQAIAPSIDSTRQRLDALWTSDFSIQAFTAKIATTSEGLSEALAQDTWKTNLPGRTILKSFVSRHVKMKGAGTPYIVFRNSILKAMVTKGYKPYGMEQILRRIISF